MFGYSLVFLLFLVAAVIFAWAGFVDFRRKHYGAFGFDFIMWALCAIVATRFV